MIESFASMSTSLPSRSGSISPGRVSTRGSSYNPYNSLTEGLNAVTTSAHDPSGSGATNETSITINKESGSDRLQRSEWETIIGLSTGLPDSADNHK